MPAQQGADEAGVSEERGRVIEPRKVESRGPQDRRRGLEVKADGVPAPAGNHPVGETFVREDVHREVLTSWATTTNFIGLLLLPRFRASLGASMPKLGWGP